MPNLRHSHARGIAVPEPMDIQVQPGKGYATVKRSRYMEFSIYERDDDHFEEGGDTVTIYFQDSWTHWQWLSISTPEHRKGAVSIALVGKAATTWVGGQLGITLVLQGGDTWFPVFLDWSPGTCQARWWRLRRALMWGSYARSREIGRDGNPTGRGRHR